MKAMEVNQTGIVKHPRGLTDDIAMKSDAREGRGGNPLDRDIDRPDIQETKEVRRLADHDQNH